MNRPKGTKPLLFPFSILFSAGILFCADNAWEKQPEEWSLPEIKQVLEKSPWCRQSLIRHFGCSVSASREVRDAFTVRLVSARPIRDAYARLVQLSRPVDVSRSLEVADPKILQPAQDRIVVAVSFRSDDLQRDLSLRQFFAKQQTSWMKWNTFLICGRSGRIEPVEYIRLNPETGEFRLIFPRSIKERAVVSDGDKELRFVLWVPPDQNLSVTWNLKAMRYRGALEY
ncbi:MAG TPA: hypothetical protein VGL91_20875 [Acidobacteriota bacterium]